MLILFSFAFDSEAKDAVIGGNIEPQVALRILQDIIIAQAVTKAQKPEEPEEETPPKP